MFSKIGGLIKVIGILVIVLELSMLLCRKKKMSLKNYLLLHLDLSIRHKA